MSADSRLVRNQTLLANGPVADGKRGPVKKWKKLDGLKRSYAQVYPLDERYVAHSRFRRSSYDRRMIH